MNENYYVHEADLQEDIAKLYETGEFPDRLTKGLMDMVEGIIHGRRFWGYTDDWKEDMRSNALQALVLSLNEKRYDPTQPNTRFFSWATKVIYNQFYNTLNKKRRELKKTKAYMELQKEGLI